MWDCEGCGCQSIAADLKNCPQCGESRPAPDAGEPTKEAKNAKRNS